MSYEWPDLPILELFVAVIDEGSVGAGARKVGMAQPNASRAIAAMERRMQTSLLKRSPRGSIPTAAGMLLAAQSRDLLDSAQRFNDRFKSSRDNEVLDLRIGASMTIAEALLPAWLAELKRRLPRASVEVQVLNSTQVIQRVQRGNIQLGFIETPNIPVRLNSLVVQEDELVVAVPPRHNWASRTSKVSLQELARTALVVREPGSGTREALDEVLAGLITVEPEQVLGSNAAIRVAVASGAGPAALSELALRDQLANGSLVRVPFEGEGTSRPLTAVWTGPRRLTGAAAELVAVAVAKSSTRILG